MNAKNFSGGLTLNTPEFFREQQNLAIDAIGSHLLVAARFQTGVAIGHKFNKRQNYPREWIERINDTIIVAGWGDLGHFKRLLGFMREIGREVKDLVTEKYVTDFPLKKNMAQLLEHASSSSQPYRIDLLFVNLAEEKLFILHFDGRSMHKSQFGVLGGYAYQDKQHLKTESDIILSKYGIAQNALPRNPPLGVMEDLNDAYERSVKTPLKDALLTLEEIYGDRDFLETKAEASDAVKNTLFLHDPQSKRETFEITIFENGNFESVYFTREKKESGGGEVEFTPEGESNDGDDEENKNEPQA